MGTRSEISIEKLGRTEKIDRDESTHYGKNVFMLGLRGIPNVQGGVEKHVEMLAGQMVARGWNIEVIGRSPYLSTAGAHEWNGVRVIPLWAPRVTSLEALVHTFLGVCYAAVRRPDILHIHAVGPALMVPLGRLFGLKVVMTHHGYDYDRQKWGSLAKTMLRLGEKLGMRLSHGRIGISGDIVSTMGARHAVPVDLVPNGVSVTSCTSPTGILEEFGIEPRRYILLAARFVPEKRQTDLIKAFRRIGEPGVRLVLAGDAKFASDYAVEVRRLAEETPGVVLTGFQTGDRLAEIFANAALFVLPSSHEGMPIALLEAMAYGLPILASDIVANKELKLPAKDYFPLGDIDALAAAIRDRLANLPDAETMRATAAKMDTEYSWASVAQKTESVYRAVLKS